MAYAPLTTILDGKVLGSFVEKDYGKTFEYIENPEMVLHPLAHGGKNVRFPHLIFVGPDGSETRDAIVKGTCVHIVTDETADGYIIEKWDIKNHRKYTK
jgi:hypothetical protein